MAEPIAAVDPAPIFAALGDHTRLSLLASLSDGRVRSITALSADKGLTRQAVTKHLRILETAGLVACARRGRERRFAFQGESLGAARGYLDRVAAQWDEALLRLKAFVEECI
jgi:DNA-binding transcriptional ArsR family regulator